MIIYLCISLGTVEELRRGREERTGKKMKWTKNGEKMKEENKERKKGFSI